MLEDKIAIIIPALNEELSIVNTIRAIPFGNAIVVVVDNGSTDNTHKLAKKEGVVVIKENRKGYGHACLAGINYLRSLNDRPELVFFLDADGADDPQSMELLLDMMKSDERLDMVLGSRLDRMEKGAMSKHAVLANRVFTKLINLIYKVKLTDMGPLRVLKFNRLLEIGMEDTGYGWTSEMIVKAIRKGFKIREVSVIYRARLGSSKISGSLIISLRAALWITVHILRHSWGKNTGE